MDDRQQPSCNLRSRWTPSRVRAGPGTPPNMTTVERAVAISGAVLVLALIAIGMGELIVPVFAAFLLFAIGSMWFRERRRHR